MGLRPRRAEHVLLQAAPGLSPKENHGPAQPKTIQRADRDCQLFKVYHSQVTSSRYSMAILPHPQCHPLGTIRKVKLRLTRLARAYAFSELPFDRLCVEQKEVNFS